ncbi:hypothetical protein MTR67_019219 [Solanum verrucosum]|uniref:Uncharacterized protein n=1 Tax=Solanum verrucosum TaxID=315347 RepID=A0AAF0QTX6_SOLVR|nr:hypothetical protein MTR67_019219 [Solanum verrucosum]
MLEVSSSKPLASESKGFAFWVELVALGLPSAGYLSYVSILGWMKGLSGSWFPRRHSIQNFDISIVADVHPKEEDQVDKAWENYRSSSGELRDLIEVGEQKQGEAVRT